MTSISPDQEHDTTVSEQSRVTISLAIIVIGFLVTGILMFGRLEARVDAEKERLDRHETRQAEQLRRVEDKLDRVLERLGPR